MLTIKQTVDAREIRINKLKTKLNGLKGESRRLRDINPWYPTGSINAKIGHTSRELDRLVEYQRIDRMGLKVGLR